MMSINLFTLHFPTMRLICAGAVVELADGRQIPCRAVVGCDGVRSRIAAQLGLPPALYAGEVYYRYVLEST
jgi:2-polyprenyl-6-methoxyphenol hydroxylase-like FAD-dependent oxidoreductase